MSKHGAAFTSCPPDADLLLAHANDLPPAENRAVEAHVRGCPACRAKLREFDATLFAVATIIKAREGGAFDFSTAGEEARMQRFKRRFDEFRQREALRGAIAPKSRGRVVAAIFLFLAGSMLMRATHAEGLAPNGLLERVRIAVLRTLAFEAPSSSRIERPPIELARAPEPEPEIVVPPPSVVPNAATHVEPRWPVTMGRGMTSLLDRRFRYAGQRQTFITELTGRAASITRRLHELSALAFETGGTRRNRARLQAVHEALGRDLDEMDAILAVLFGSHTRTFPLRQLPTDWQRRATEALPHSIRLNESLAQLLAADDIGPVEGRYDGKYPTVADPEAAFSKLWETLNGEP